MADRSELSTKEVLDAQAHIWNHIFNFINSMSLKYALQLNIPDIIHKPITLSKLTNALLIPESKSHSLPTYAYSGPFKFFIETPEEGYSLTLELRLLLKDDSLSITPFALAMLDPIFIDPWHNLGKWIQSEENCTTSYEATHGKKFSQHVVQDPKFSSFFNIGMASDARLIAIVLVEDCREVFKGLESIVDVRGGTGMVVKILSDAFPGLKCVVLDRSQVIHGLESSEKLTFIA